MIPVRIQVRLEALTDRIFQALRSMRCAHVPLTATRLMSMNWRWRTDAPTGCLMMSRPSGR